MPRDGSQTKARILSHAEDLFRERSYSGFSYNDISRPLGIKNAAIHYHFPSKGDLGVAIIDRYRRILNRVTRNQPTTGVQAVKQLETLFEFEATLNARDQRVCPLAVLATDYANITTEMRLNGQRLVNELIAWLAQVLEVGRQGGEIKFEGKPTDKAATICAAFVGARQLSRIAGQDLLSDTVKQVRRDLGLQP